ncbi:MAG: Jag N-terminal domain-containing protein, partial [Candidatus Binatia bacterium]
MDFVETEGDTIDDAIDDALKTLGVSRDKVMVDIVSEGRKGIFGFGAQKARVRATLRKVLVHALPDEEPEAHPPPVTAAELAVTTEKAKTALQEILKLMGVAATVETKAGETTDEIILE